MLLNYIFCLFLVASSACMLLLLPIAVRRFAIGGCQASSFFVVSSAQTFSSTFHPETVLTAAPARVGPGFEGNLPRWSRFVLERNCYLASTKHGHKAEKGSYEASAVAPTLICASYCI
uniref:Putative secreted protein n=1 Tax=Amblyomma parvum TaxID=251391 RepID=A0A023G059_AMBPA